MAALRTIQAQLLNSTKSFSNLVKTLLVCRAVERECCKTSEPVIVEGNNMVHTDEVGQHLLRANDERKEEQELNGFIDLLPTFQRTSSDKGR